MKDKEKLKLPTFIIAGAQKSGTTSLHYALAKHPDIFMSEPKELNFFNIDSNYEKGIEWYSSFFKSWHSEKVAGECTPEYMWDKRVAERMPKIIPSAKILFILRNPIDRAYSAYWHAVRYGRENLSFEEAIKVEPERMKKDYMTRRYNSYIDRGFYYRQIKPFLKYYDNTKIIILIFEEYKENPIETLIKVTNFFEISHDSSYLSRASIERRNIAMIPRSIKLQSLYKVLNKHFPMATRLLGRLNLKKEVYSPMAEHVREMLVNKYYESNRQLEELLKKKLIQWD